MNPNFVLPIFLGACVIGLAIWNVVMTGTIHRLEINLAEKEDEITDYVEAIRILNSKIPAHGKNGRFQKRSN